MEELYRPGDVVEGIVTNVLPYGIFVHIDAQTTGLIHISEIVHGYVSDIHHFGHIGQRVIVKILDVDTDKKQLKLSLKSAPKQVKYQRLRRHRYNVLKKQLLPTSRIGFESLKKQLPQWVKEYQKND